MIIGEGKLVALYWRWPHHYLPFLHFYGLSVGARFVGFVAETRLRRVHDYE